MMLALDAARGVMRRDMAVFLTYRTQLVTQVLAVLFQLTIFYFISRLLHAKTFASSEAYFAYVVVGLGISQVLVVTMGAAPTRVRQELVAGTMERFMVSSFGAVRGVMSMLLFPICLGLTIATIMFILAAAIFGLHLVGTAPLALPAAMLGSLAFTPFALILVAFVVAFKQLAAGASFVSSLVALVGGLYFPVALLPHWIRWASSVQPFTPAADLLRHLLVNTKLQYSVPVDLLKLFGFAAVLFPIGIFLLHRAIIFGQRRGTIFEY